MEHTEDGKQKVEFMATPMQKALMRAMADKAGLSLASWARTKLIAVAQADVCKTGGDQA